MKLAVCAALVLLSAGCVAGRGFGTSPGEYALYRRSRTAEKAEFRLMAGAQYLAEYPKGAWHEEVRVAFTELEEAWYEVQRKSQRGLREYLAALPAGPHAERAKALVDAENERERRAGSLAAGREIEQKIAKASEGRKAARGAFETYLGGFLDPETFQVPLAKAKRELVVPWTLELPPPVCKSTSRGTETSCFKVLDLPFELTGDDTREATLQVTIARSAAGIPLEAKLAGPGLFVRLEEARSARPVDEQDPKARGAATKEAAKFVREIFGRARPGASLGACEQPAKPPAALVLSCDGVVLSVVAGKTPADEDFVLVLPVATR